MIRITQPIIEKRQDGIYLTSSFVDENASMSTEIWYRTTEEYASYLNDESADAFVLLALLPAIYSHQNIEVQGTLSEKLYYQLSTAGIYTLTKIFYPSQVEPTITISCEKIRKPEIRKGESFAVGCGCSLGVDSLSAIKRYLPPPMGHSQQECTKSFQLTHLTYFNIGALGEYDINEAKIVYQKNLELVKDYANKIGLPVVTLESNASCLFIEKFDFNQSHVLRNMSAALALSKLFGKYLYASAYPAEDTYLDDGDIAHADLIMLPLLSTERTSLISADADKSRTKKTEYIASDSLVQQSLYVCWRDIAINGHHDSQWAKEIQEVKYLNCTRCDKCLRTLITLDILGEINNYGTIFDLEHYKKIRESYIFKVLTHQEDAFYRDIANLMKENNFIVPKKVRLKLKLKKYHLLWLWRKLSKIWQI